jgi:hypothetical protein
MGGRDHGGQRSHPIAQYLPNLPSQTFGELRRIHVVPRARIGRGEYIACKYESYFSKNSEIL